MAAENVEVQYFEHLAEYSIAVCKECRHGVLPSHIESHLQRIHRIKQSQARSVAEGVRNWAGVAEYASELIVPSCIIPPISGIPLYSDGLICQLDQSRCHQILRSEEGMKKHWREVHGYSIASKRGRPSQVSKSRVVTSTDLWSAPDR
jgi:hypothetical protein